MSHPFLLRISDLLHRLRICGLGILMTKHIAIFRLEILGFPPALLQRRLKEPFLWVLLWEAQRLPGLRLYVRNCSIARARTRIPRLQWLFQSRYRNRTLQRAMRPILLFLPRCFPQREDKQWCPRVLVYKIFGRSAPVITLAIARWWMIRGRCYEPEVWAFSTERGCE